MELVPYLMQQSVKAINPVKPLKGVRNAKSNSPLKLKQNKINDRKYLQNKEATYSILAPNVTQCRRENLCLRTSVAEYSSISRSAAAIFFLLTFIPFSNNRWLCMLSIPEYEPPKVGLKKD